MGKLDDVFQDELARQLARDCLAALDDALRDNPAWGGMVDAELDESMETSIEVHRLDRDDDAATVPVALGSPRGEIRRCIQDVIDVAERADMDGGRAWLEARFRQIREWRDFDLLGMAKRGGVSLDNVLKLLASSPVDCRVKRDADGAEATVWTARDGWPGPEAAG